MAITAAEVQSALAPVVQPVRAQSSIVLAPGLSVTVAAFAALFADATALTGQALAAIDGGALGYASYIDAWVAAGYIPAS